MIEGLILGSLSFASMGMTWKHLPDIIKNLSLRFPFVTDIASGILVFTLLTGFSSSLVAVIGAVTAGLLVNFTLLGYKYVKGNS